MQFTKDETARLRASRAALMKRLNGLPEKHQRTVLIATANPGLREGREVPDVYAQALAKQMLEGFEIRDRVTPPKPRLPRLAAKMRQRVGDPDWPRRASMIARKAELQQGD